jgi:hypothetical protein
VVTTVTLATLYIGTLTNMVVLVTIVIDLTHADRQTWQPCTRSFHALRAKNA